MLKVAASLVSPHKLRIVRKAKVPKDTPIVFASTHESKDDIVNAIIVANAPTYTLIGGLKQFLLRPDRSGLPRFARNDGGLDRTMV